AGRLTVLFFCLMCVNNSSEAMTTMKTPTSIRIRSSIFACSLFFLLPAAKADTDAVTPLAIYAEGYVVGGCGFSFTPTTNLAVTRVGYLDQGNSNPIIKFW